jgi:mitochondrial inner membrane protease subunit 2
LANELVGTHCRSPSNPETLSVKRVVATQGQQVMTRRTHRILVVPEAHIWVEGDANDDDKSLDSNSYGPISVRLVEGRLTHILYPLHKFGQIAWWEHRPPLRKWQNGV